MIWPDSWGSPGWLIPGIILSVLGFALASWVYLRSHLDWPRRILALSLRCLGLTLLVICLLEPTGSRQVPERNSNTIVALVDRSRSLSIRDRSSREETRAEVLRNVLHDDADWQLALEENYDFRRYFFDVGVQAVDSFEGFQPDGEQSHVWGALQTIQDRIGSSPAAGVLLFSDGNATDSQAQNLLRLRTPIFPVIVGDSVSQDLAITNVTINQTDFELAPVAIGVEMIARGRDQSGGVVVQLLGEDGKEIERTRVVGVKANQRFAVRFETKNLSQNRSFPWKGKEDQMPFGVGAKPTHGPGFFTVRAAYEANWKDFENGDPGNEATLANNQRTVVADRAHGPYRVLYVCGRPNWELKFLGRAVYDDPEIELTSLIRVAKKEPKFSFRSRRGESTNPLFRGFGNDQDEQAEQYSEPVLIVYPTNDPLSTELQHGFPKTAEVLFQFDAIIVDDIESEFFSPEQQDLLHQFVSTRGGGLLMLGGQESFGNGGYARSPIGDLLPVYLENRPNWLSAGLFRIGLTREGWLQPWVRLRSTESQEQGRLESMPIFNTYSPVNSIKPGASVMANVTTPDGNQQPAVVVQRFGKGHTGAILVGDLWRWQTNGPNPEDLPRSWRQTIRWLVSDVPHRLEIEINQEEHSRMIGVVTLRDEKYDPLDNANVKIFISPAVLSEATPSSTTPIGSDSSPTTDSPNKNSIPAIEMTATPDDSEIGKYHFEFVPQTEGPYRVDVIAVDDQGETIGNGVSGWVSQRSIAEFQDLEPNREVLESLANRSGGRIIELDQLSRFCESIPNNETMVTRTVLYPWWHNWKIFVSAIACFVIEWGIRRWKGLP